MKPSAILVALAFTAAGTLGATITLDEATRYQTIEGFGAFGGLYPTWAGTPLYTDAFVDRVVNDLGLSALRYDYSTGTEVMDYFRKLKAAGMTKLIISTWSPPASWKDNNSEINGGALLPSRYTDFANLCVSTIRTIQQQSTMEVYGISLQNEPDFAEPYSSCVYTPAQYRDLVKVAGPIIHAQFPSVKLFGAEHMLAYWGTFEGTLNADSVSRNQMGAYAVHGYSDGVHPQPGSTAVTLWSRAYGNIRTTGKGLWMTETSGYLNTNWTDCFHLGEMIYAALKYGKLSLWTWWQLSEAHHANADDDRYSMMYDGNPSKLYYVAKNYYRYVRPGAVQVRSGCSDTLILATAFTHATDRTMTLVILNATASQQSVSIVGGPASYTAYRTSSSDNCASQGTVQKGAITLPASSITTLYATNYATAVDPGPVPGVRRASRVASSDALPAALYGLDGRMVRAAAAGLPPGAWLAGSVTGAARLMVKP